MTVSSSSITLSPPGNHLSSFFGYSNGYVPTTSLATRGGYWVKSDSAGYMVMAGSVNTPKQGTNERDRYNYMTITDGDGNSQSLYFVQDPDGKIRLSDYEMPPMFPTEEFSLKYHSGRILETYPAGITEMKTFPIDVNISHEPVKISWTINTKEGKQYLLSDGAKGKLFKTIELKGTSGTVTGIKADIHSILLQINSGADVPHEFSLSQNYPNPFNPTTRLVVGLPQSAHLEVSV